MLRRLCCMALLLSLLAACGAAEWGEGLFDFGVLDPEEELECWLDDNRIDLIYRPAGQPFRGESDEGDVRAFLDYVSLSNEGVVVPRLLLAMQLDDMLCAGTVTFTAGDFTVTAPADPTTTEYDGIVQEEYAVFLLGELQPLAEALAKGDGTLRFTLNGERTVRGTAAIPAETAAALWQGWLDAGGLSQPLDRLQKP